MNQNTKFIHFYAPCRGDMRPMSCVCLLADRNEKGELVGVGLGIARCHPDKDIPKREAGRNYSFARAKGALQCRSTKFNMSQVILTYFSNGKKVDKSTPLAIIDSLEELDVDNFSAVNRINGALEFAWENGRL